MKNEKSTATFQLDVSNAQEIIDSYGFKVYKKSGDNIIYKVQGFLGVGITGYFIMPEGKLILTKNEKEIEKNL